MEKIIKAPEMWSINEAIKQTNLSRVFITRLIKNEKIAYVNTGRKYLINAESLCNYLTNGEKEEQKDGKFTANI